MKRFVSAVAGLCALGWSGIALSQTAISCANFANFTCAFSAAETASLAVPKPTLPGQPDVYLGYLAFSSDGKTVTMTGTSNINGVVTKSLSSTGACADAPAANQPATITFTDGTAVTELSFVTDSSNTELQFIISSDSTGTKTNVANLLRIGICRKQ